MDNLPNFHILITNCYLYPDFVNLPLIIHKAISKKDISFSLDIPRKLTQSFRGKLIL